LEPDRDLIAILDGCHTLAHQWERKLRQIGVSLRATTWLVILRLFPIRLGRWVGWVGTAQYVQR